MNLRHLLKRTFAFRNPKPFTPAPPPRFALPETLDTAAPQRHDTRHGPVIQYSEQQIRAFEATHRFPRLGGLQP